MDDGSWGYMLDNENTIINNYSYLFEQFDVIWNLNFFERYLSKLIGFHLWVFDDQLMKNKQTNFGYQSKLFK
jgi:hypothetical protein